MNSEVRFRLVSWETPSLADFYISNHNMKVKFSFVVPISSTIACIVGLLTVSVVVYPAISVTVTSLVTLYKVPFLLFTYNVLGPGHGTIGVVDLAVNRLQYRPLALTFRFNIILCKASNSKIMSVKFD